MTIRVELYPTGRKHCSRCGCWRPIHDFGVANRSRGVLQAGCKTCDRIVHRQRGGYAARRVGYCRHGHRLTQDNRHYRRDGHFQCLECRRRTTRDWYRNMTPDQRAKRREWERIYGDTKRRERGARKLSPRQAEAPRGHEPLNIPAKPFGDWLRANQPPDTSPEDWAVVLGCDATGIRQHIAGKRSVVHIDFVDRVLTAADAHLIDIYPELYDFEEVA